TAYSEMPCRRVRKGTASLLASRSIWFSFSPSLITEEEYAPAKPRSEVISKTAALVGFSASVVSGWSTLENVATAETALVSSRAYGAADCARCCALMILEAALSSIARVTFLMVVTEARRCRSSRRLAGISASLLPHDLLLRDILFLQRDVLLAAGQQLALRGLEALLELGNLLAKRSGRIVVEILGFPDVAQHIAVVTQMVQQLALDGQNVINGHLVHQTLNTSPD